MVWVFVVPPHPSIERFSVKDTRSKRNPRVYDSRITRSWKAGVGITGHITGNMTGHAVMPGHGQELPVSAWPTGASGGGAPQSSVHIGTRGGSVVASGSSLCRCDDGARGANAGDDIGSQTRRAVAAGAAEAAIIGQRRGAGGGVHIGTWTALWRLLALRWSLR